MGNKMKEVEMVILVSSRVKRRGFINIMEQKRNKQIVLSFFCV